MADRSERTALLNEMLEYGDRDGTLKARLYSKFKDKVKAVIKKEIDKYPALIGKVSPTDIYDSIIYRLRKATAYHEAKSGTAVMISKGKNRIRAKNNYEMAQMRAPGVEDGSEEARAGLVDKAPTAEEIMIQREQAEFVNRCLAELSAKDREILTLRGADVLTFPEIGEALKISKEAARKRYTTAKVRLMAKIELGQFQE